MLETVLNLRLELHAIGLNRETEHGELDCRLDCRLDCSRDAVCS